MLRTNVLAISAAALLALAGCDDDPACEVGATQSCTCDDGASGSQTGLDEGTFGACTCGGTDAGMGGVDAGMPVMDAGSDAGAPIDDGGLGEDAGVAGDAGTATDAGADDSGVADAGTDGGTDAATDAGPDGGVGCDGSGFAPSTFFTGGDAETLYHEMILPSGDAKLFLELYFSSGAPETPTTVTFTGVPYDSCSTCLFLQSEYNSSTSMFDRAYLVQSGTVEFTTLSRTQMVGTLRNIRMAEVTYNPITFATSVVPGGLTWCFEELAFTGSL